MTPYTAKQADASGHIHYTPEENNTWGILYQRQVDIIQHRACRAFIEGLEQLGLSQRAIPQLPTVTDALQAATGWSVTQVPAMITADQFFSLLANRVFPVATFIRRPESLDYLKEPDIFHELFGHCPLITHKPFADFLEAYGEKALALDAKYRTALARLFWFTVEFGLIQGTHGPLCYGGGILSSKNETLFSVESTRPRRLPFDLLTVLRTPYHVDQIQGTYFVIADFKQLFELLEHDLESSIEQAEALPPLELIKIDEQANKDAWVTC